MTQKNSLEIPNIILRKKRVAGVRSVTISRVIGRPHDEVKDRIEEMFMRMKYDSVKIQQKKQGEKNGYFIDQDEIEFLFRFYQKDKKKDLLSFLQSEEKQEISASEVLVKMYDILEQNNILMHRLSAKIIDLIDAVEEKNTKKQAEKITISDYLRKMKIKVTDEQKGLLLDKCVRLSVRYADSIKHEAGSDKFHIDIVQLAIIKLGLR